MVHTKKLIFLGLLLALSAIGSRFIFFGSISLDVVAAACGALLLGPFYGALLGCVGHVISAFTNGLPYGIPLHSIIALLTGLSLWAFGTVHRLLKRKFSPLIAMGGALIVGYLCNVPLSLTILYPFLKGLIWILWVPLSVASLLNFFLGTVIYELIHDKISL